MAGVSEKAGVYKLGNGGMTSLARAILDEYRGDLLFGTVVTEISHTAVGVAVKTLQGQLSAMAIVSTIPL
jgi:lysyl oxidase-like protein 2/3/4